MDEEYIKAIKEYETMMSGLNDDDGSQHLVIHQPDSYIKLIIENMMLKKENSYLKSKEQRFVNEIHQNINLLDKLRWCAEELKNLKVNVPFKIDGSNR